MRAESSGSLWEHVRFSSELDVIDANSLTPRRNRREADAANTSGILFPSRLNPIEPRHQERIQSSSRIEDEKEWAPLRRQANVGELQVELPSLSLPCGGGTPDRN